MTLPTATHTERDRYETIEELNNDLSEWQAAVVRALKEGDRKVTDKLYADRLEDTARRLVKINGELHATDFAPEWIAEVRGLLLDGLQVTAAGNPLDTFDKLLINIEAIRHLRYYGWQDVWLARIMVARQHELNLKIITSIWRMLITCTNMLASGLFPVVAFWAYTVLTDKPLRVDVAFPALQLFSMLETYLRELPNLITVCKA